MTAWRTAVIVTAAMVAVAACRLRFRAHREGWLRLGSVQRNLTRRIVLSVITVVVVALVAGGILAIGAVRKPYPQTAGELSVDGLAGRVEVLRDARSVPTIVADTSADLFFGQGYVAAQDRFFQMDLGRHITAGRMAELVGEPGVETDRVIRTMGWRRVAEAELPLLDPDSRANLQSFANGVNAYLAQRRSEPESVSLEYSLLMRELPGYRIEAWTPVDSLAWMKAMAWDLRSDYEDELGRARLSRTMSAKQVAMLYPRYPADRNKPILSGDEWAPLGGGAAVQPAAVVTAQPAAAVQPATAAQPAAAVASPAASPAFERAHQALAAVPNLFGQGDGIGSNSWVVSGKHTTTGKPILANDPHLSLGIPSVFSQVSLQCRTISAQCPYQVSGFSLPSFPGVVIGHNARIAWGFTNEYADVTDFYLEKVKDATYLRDGSYVPLQTRVEVIKVAGGSDVSFAVRSTVHGPIMSDEVASVREAGDRPAVRGANQSERFDVSLAWTALQPTEMADWVFETNRASSWNEFRSAAQKFAVPAQNLVYADVDGHIGYQAPGRIPVRASATTGAPPGYWPAPGWESQWDWKGFVPFERMPFVLDPADGVIVAANQSVTGGTEPFLSTEFDYGYRAQRIADLIAQRTSNGGKLSVAAMQEIQADTRNPFAHTLVEQLLNVQVDDFTAQAQAYLNNWNGEQPAGLGRDSASAAYYNAVWRHLLAATFEELPPDLAPTGGGRWMAVMQNLLADPKNDWWDDKRTAGVTEGAGEVLREALVNARLDLAKKLGKMPATWRWGRLHQLTLKHKIMSGDSIPGPIRSLFTVSGIELPGGGSIVNANSWNASSAGYDVTDGPVFRMVVDLADFDASTWVSSTGQSGHAMNTHYHDQTDTWARVESFPWAYTDKTVRDAAEQVLVLSPGTSPTGSPTS